MALSIRRIVAILIALSCSWFVYLFLSSDYPDMVTGLLKTTGRSAQVSEALNDGDWMTAYHTGKFIAVLAWLAVLGILYDASFRLSGKPARWIGRVGGGILSMLKGNRDFWRQLSPVIRVGLALVGALQVIFYLYFLLHLPFSYEESFSYNNFSGRGFAASALYFPSAVNQILYDLVARVFSLLPIPAQIATRLPSLFASLIGGWYFFKLTFRHFKPAIALILLAIFTGSFPVMLGGIAARGYSFMILCTTLLLYAVDLYVSPAGQRKHLVLYVLASVAGLYTAPVFLFTVFPLTVGVLLYLWSSGRGKALRRIIAGQEVVLIVMLVLYLPVIAVSHPGSLVTQDGSSLRPVRQLIHDLMPAMRASWYFLLGTSRIPVAAVILLLGATVLMGFLHRRRGWVLYWLVLVLLLSMPFLYVCMPGSAATRTWTCLIVPLVISIGCLLDWLTSAANRRAPDLQRRRQLLPGALLLAGCCIIVILLSLNFKAEHRWRFAVDYQIGDDVKKLGANIDRVRTIGITGGPWEFYVAEEVYFRRFARNPNQAIGVNNSQYRYNREDVLILQPDSATHIRLAGYLLVGQHPGFYSMYLRAIPDTTAMP